MVARRWLDLEHPIRADAVALTLTAPNRFTEQALAFAINQQMNQLTAERFLAWIDERVSPAPRAVGVLAAGNVPFAELQDFLAVLGTGHGYIGVLSSKSPYLLPAFVDEVRDELEGLDAEFTTFADMVSRVEAVIATGSDETMAEIRLRLDDAGVASERRLIRGHRFSIAVLDGRESEDEREGLSEDAFLHEGLGCRNVAIVWAPADTSPDAYLDAFANFRAVFPAHERTPGSLKMHQAMLAAVDVPHAYADGLEFLMSKGDPDPQTPGHLRWAEYTSLDEVEKWIEQHQDAIQAIVARSQVATRLGASALEILPPGQTQRPELAWQADGIDTVDFLYRLR